MTANKVQEGKINRCRTMDLIRTRPGVSRIEAAEALGLNRSTLTHIVNDLLASGFVAEEQLPSASGRGGRRPIGLKLTPFYLLGIEWQSRFIRITLCTLSGEAVYHKQVDTVSYGRSEFIRVVKEHIEILEKKFGCRICGAGIGLPGRINPHRGIVIESRPLEISSLPLAEELYEALGIPVLIENDANCFAWGEIEERKEFGGNLLCMLLEFHSSPESRNWDQEVGMGIVSRGSVYHGSNYAAGELPAAGGSADGRSLVLRNLKDRSSEEALEYCRTLFSSLEPVISVLDPEILILGGDFSFHRALFEPALKELLSRPWTFSGKGVWEVARGAASFFAKTIFTLPGFNDDALYRGGWEEVLHHKEER